MVFLLKEYKLKGEKAISSRARIIIRPPPRLVKNHLLQKCGPEVNRKGGCGLGTGG
jgi:hypothetical protein